MTQKKTVLIVDDHPLYREGLKAIIARSPAFEVAGEAGDAEEGLWRAKALRPDLALVDISLSGGQNGIDLVRGLKSTLPDTRVLVVSMHSGMDYITEAFQAGALGYMVKESAGDGLLKALEAVATGTFFLDSSVSREVVLGIVNTPGVRSVDDDYASLTPREQKILRLLAEGQTAKEIANRLCISPKTVENHRTNIMRKLELRRPMDLIRYAVRIGLIDVDQWKD
ncbi:two component transcriptional regulator, LuxR family [Desulfonatronum thiosulfatophilum]|uniref:Two component transcriptional regulator, LuxR family n=1 Tax=Desulfonatronum thiosulfatophilum TaxID=617002 RepID=A0A1G6EPL7_9BACT|nr:response regulator transcription factor [Desulfonatronum thiosulfatophilum]SDB59347.1 two component transcriptional regulator, LuxR family [Desulfonatronum thiosulfatophilum]